MMSPFWDLVASNAVVAGALAVLACALERVWKNPAALHLLWLAVMLKLFTPPIATLPIPISLKSAPKSGGALEPSVHREEGARGARRSATAVSLTRPDVGLQTELQPPFPPSAGSSLPAIRPIPPTSLLATAWLVGSGALLMGYAVRIGRFARAMRRFDPAPADLQRLVADLSARLGLRRAPTTRVTDMTLPPLVWSLAGPPRLVLPRRLFERLSSEGRQAILTHELAHIRRRDHLVRHLELLAKVAFWWHPVVWWASRRLRDLEEECCDGLAVESGPREARAYAMALIETFDFLSATRPFTVPLPTAIHSTPISRRLHMMAHPRVVRLNVRAALLAAGLMIPPLTLAFATETIASQANTATHQKRESLSPAPPTIFGTVKGPKDAPVAGALVRVVVTTVNPRTEPPPPDARVYEARTDASGAYKITCNNITENTYVSMDVLARGFVRSSGLPGWGGDDRQFQIAPGQQMPASFELAPSRYFRGVAVDDEGKPIAGARVTLHIHDDESSGWAEVTKTAEDGSFAIYNCSNSATGVGWRKGTVKAKVGVTRPDHVHGVLEDLLSIPEDQRESLRVVLPRGAAISGTVVDAAGEPAAGVVVRVHSDANVMKSAGTDAQGAFRLAGIEKARVKLSVISPGIGQKAEQEIQVGGDLTGLSIRLRAMELPASTTSYDVLGLKLADLDPKTRAAYTLYREKGAMILDPGDDPGRLGIGLLRRSYVFWMVGDERVGSVREFVERVIAEAEAQTSLPAPVRVVYEFHDERGDGNNTQYLKITQADLDQLKQVLAQFN